jgi:sodium-type polar flagellar protein MotX
MMRYHFLFWSFLVCWTANAAESISVPAPVQVDKTTASPAAGLSADPDYIPPSTAIFAGMDSPKPEQPRSSSSEQQFSQSVNEALNRAPKNTKSVNGGATGPKPLDVAPLQVPDSPDKQDNSAVISSHKVENIPAELLQKPVTSAPVDELPIIEIYDQEELISLINEDKHLHRVADIDECQLVKDIELRAKVVKLPAYQYLWGDMLLTGTCTSKNVEVGIEYLWKSAQQGMPAALEHLAQYYAKGRYVQRDMQQAAIFMHEAAAQGYLKAQIGWVDMLVKGQGSPLDYEEAYSWLHHTVIADDKQHKQAARLLARLSQKMPPNIVGRAKIYRWQ